MKLPLKTFKDGLKSHLFKKHDKKHNMSELPTKEPTCIYISFSHTFELHTNTLSQMQNIRMTAVYTLVKLIIHLKCMYHKIWLFS